MAPKAKKIAKADKPKKKLSGYMKFAKERRPSLLKEKPNLSFGEVRAPSPLARACARSTRTFSPPRCLHRPDSHRAALAGGQDDGCGVAQDVRRAEGQVQVSASLRMMWWGATCT